MSWQAILGMVLLMLLVLGIGALAIVWVVKEARNHWGRAKPWICMKRNKPYLVDWAKQYGRFFHAALLRINDEGFIEPEPQFFWFDQPVNGDGQTVVTRQKVPEKGWIPVPETLAEFLARCKQAKHKEVNP